MRIDWRSTDSWCIEEVTLMGDKDNNGLEPQTLVWRAQDQWNKHHWKPANRIEGGYTEGAPRNSGCLNMDLDSKNYLELRGRGWSVDYDRTVYGTKNPDTGKIIASRGKYRPRMA